MNIGGYTVVDAMSRPLGDFSYIVFGSESNDALFGDGKSDRLYGGAGEPRSPEKSGGRTGQRHLPLHPGAGTANVWKNAAQGITYTLKGSGASQILLISRDGSADGIRVQGWSSGQLGLAMAGTLAPPATTTIAGQDGYSDALTGSGGADLMQGLSDNDALDGSNGVFGWICRSRELNGYTNQHVIAAYN